MRRFHRINLTGAILVGADLTRRAVIYFADGRWEHGVVDLFFVGLCVSASIMYWNCERADRQAKRGPAHSASN